MPDAPDVTQGPSMSSPLIESGIDQFVKKSPFDDLKDAAREASSPIMDQGGCLLDPCKNILGETDPTDLIEEGNNIATQGIMKEQSLFSKLGGIISTGWTQLVTAISTGVSSLIAVFVSTSAAETSAGALGDVAVVGAVTAAASGGLIRGVGSSISDSIPAMLSNGEFVVNAKATKDNLRLLFAINEGNIRKFAQGGLVGSTNFDVPVYKEMPETSEKRSGESVTQEFNISITGDISKQTRREIYSMIPQIAGGVNRYNHEKLRR